MSKGEAVLITMTLVAYAAAFALAVAGLALGRESALRVSRWAAALGVAAHTGSLAVRWAASGHAPIATAYENGSTAAWAILVLTFLAPRRSGLYRAAGAGAVALALIILGWALMQDHGAAPMSASLKSIWLYVHVFFAFLAYAAFSIASGAALTYVVKQRVGEAGLLGRVPALDVLDVVAYRYVVFGFVTCAVMIAAGALWAKDLWGAYWSWDPVETWNLVAWLAYGLLIHLRVTYGWRGPRFAWVALFAVLLVIIAYFWVGEFVGATQHIFTVPVPPTF